jgi:hypothetical protein
MESLELEEQRVWKHEFKSKQPIFFIYLFIFVLVLVLVGAIANF